MVRIRSFHNKIPITLNSLPQSTLILKEATFHKNPQGNSQFPQGGGGNGITGSNPNGDPSRFTTIDAHSNPSFGGGNSTGSTGGNQVPTANGPGGGQQNVRTSGSGPLSCQCSEQTCNGGSCKGSVCYTMTFPADRVQLPAFAGRQGEVVQTGCSDDTSVLIGGAQRLNRPNVTYRFKLNGQEVVVPAQAVYCKDADYCNSNGTGGAGVLSIASTTLAFAVSLALLFRRL